MPQGCRPAGAEIARRDPVGSIPVHRTAVLLLGHGSRAAAANEAFEALVADFARGHPGLEVAHAYIELASPLLSEALAALAARAERVIVLPLFLLTAGHLKDDLPAALAAARRSFPRVRFEAARALGVTNELVEVGLERLGGAGPDAGRVALLGVGRGSSHADANGDFCKLVRIVGERGGFARAEPCFIAVARPRSPDALAELARSHAARSPSGLSSCSRGSSWSSWAGRWPSFAPATRIARCRWPTRSRRTRCSSRSSTGA